MVHKGHNRANNSHNRRIDNRRTDNHRTDSIGRSIHRTAGHNQSAQSSDCHRHLCMSIWRRPARRRAPAWLLGLAPCPVPSTYIATGQKWPWARSPVRCSRQIKRRISFVMWRAIEFASLSPQCSRATLRCGKSPEHFNCRPKPAGWISIACTCRAARSRQAKKFLAQFGRWDSRSRGKRLTPEKQGGALSTPVPPRAVLGTDYRTAIRGKARPFGKYRIAFPAHLPWQPGPPPAPKSQRKGFNSLNGLHIEISRRRATRSCPDRRHAECTRCKFFQANSLTIFFGRTRMERLDRPQR
jgi:hypothetical protein